MAISVVREDPFTASVWDTLATVTPTPGNWLVAVVSWRYNIPGQLPSTSITDACRNIWYLLSTKYTRAENVSMSTGYALNTQVWVCPAVKYAGWNYQLISASLQSSLGGDQCSHFIDFIEVAGMGNGFLTVESITPYRARGVGAITMAAPAPSANSLMVASACVSNGTWATFTTTGTGWTGMAPLVRTAPDAGQLVGWREGNTASSVTFTLNAGTGDWAGVIVAFRTSGIVPTGPPGQNPNMPVVEAGMGFGYDLSTPLPAVWFTDQGQWYWGMNHKRGIQYELGQAQSEPTSITWRNDEGKFSPRNVQNPATIVATGTGTTGTLICSATDAALLNVSDVFRLTYSALNPNTGFESGATGWTATGGTFTQPVVGTGHTGQIVPTGVAATVQVESDHMPVTPGSYYAVAGTLANAVARSCTLRATWYDGSGTLISSNSVTQPLVANASTPTSGLFFAPPLAATGSVMTVMTGTPPATNIMTFDNVKLSPASEFTAFQVTNILANGGSAVISFTDADGSGGASVPTKAGDVLSVTPIDMYMPYQITNAWAGKRHYVSAGWIERWPQNWVDPAWGTVGALTVGSLSTITGNLQTALVSEIMRRLPVAYWPLNDAAGSGSATNVSGRTVGPLVVTKSKYGAAANQVGDFGGGTQEVNIDPNNVTTTVGGATATLFGDPGTGWVQTFDHTLVTPPGVPQGSLDLNASKGFALVGADTGSPSIANGATLWFAALQTIADEDVMYLSNIDSTAVMLRDTDPADGVGQGSVIKVSASHLNGGTPIVTVWNKTTHAATATQCNTGNVFGRNWTIFALTFNQTSWKLYTNALLAGSGSCNLVDSFTAIDVGGEADQFHSGLCFPGTMAHVAIFDRQLSTKEIEWMSSAALFGLGNSVEYTSQRQQRFLDMVGNKNTRISSDPSGQLILDGQGTDYTTVADGLAGVSSCEDSYMFEDAGGAIQIRPNSRYSQQEVRASLGGNVAGGDIPYLGDVATDFDPTFLYDVVSVQNTTQSIFAFVQNTQTSVFTAVNDQAKEKYNYRTYQRNVRIYPTNQQFVFYLDYWLLSQYSNPTQRFRTLTLDPASNPALWEFCLTVEVADLLLVKHNSVDSPPIVATCVVMQVQVDSGPGNYRVTLTLAPARSSGLLLNDNPKGIAGINYFTME